MNIGHCFILLAAQLGRLGISASSPPISFEAFFRSEEFNSSDAVVASPDGKWVAYGTRVAPEKATVNDRYLPNGTPSAELGARIHITDAQGKTKILVCGQKENC